MDRGLNSVSLFSIFINMIVYGVSQLTVLKKVLRLNRGDEEATVRHKYADLWFESTVNSKNRLSTSYMG